MSQRAPTTQACDDCGAELGPRDPRMQCERCGGLLSLVYDPPDQRGIALHALFDSRLTLQTAQGVPHGISGVWRFRELVLPDASDTEVVTQPEGNTTLLQRERVARWCGVSTLFLSTRAAIPRDRSRIAG